MTAIDLLVYALRTRGWALYGVNPLALAPAQWPGSDPWLGLAAEWINAPSPYGPVWEVLSLSGYYASGGVVLNHLFALKWIATGAYLGSAALIYVTLRQIKPEWQ